MSKNKLELSGLNDQELNDKLAEMQTEFASMQFNHRASGLANTATLTIARRDIARIHTEIRKRQLANASEADLAKRSKIRARRRRK